jgi:hypothetical protein
MVTLLPASEYYMGALVWFWWSRQLAHRRIGSLRDSRSSDRRFGGRLERSSSVATAVSCGPVLRLVFPAVGLLVFWLVRYVLKEPVKGA